MQRVPAPSSKNRIVEPVKVEESTNEIPFSKLIEDTIEFFIDFACQILLNLDSMSIMGPLKHIHSHSANASIKSLHI